MAFITVSTGVGGGVVSNGTLLTGAGGWPDTGHSLADPDGPLCGCGRVGCVEAIASGRGIAAAATDDLCGLDAKSIFTFAAQGHPQARLLIQHSAQTLARMIADLKALADCQCVVVGGSIGTADGYLPLVRTIWRKNRLFTGFHYAQHTIAMMLACWERRYGARREAMIIGDVNNPLLAGVSSGLQRRYPRLDHDLLSLSPGSVELQGIMSL